MKLAHISSLALALLTLSAVGCGSPTGVSLNDVAAQHALWSAEHLTAYSFDFQETGFFICCFEGKALRLQVRNDTVVSAIDASGQPVPGCPPSCFGRTIDDLFTRAEQAARDQRLAGITFDPVLHYPTRIDIAGPPDASGSDFATNLQNLH